MDVTKIDRQAWAWHKRIMAARRNESLSVPLPHDRLELLKMATRREDPSKEAFLTLALMEYPEDLETLPIGQRSATLPYQLAWARAGWTLRTGTGLPGGIVKARWPEVPYEAITGTLPAASASPRAARVRRESGEPGERDDVVPEVWVERSPDVYEQLGFDGMPSVQPRTRRAAHYQRDTGASQPALSVRERRQG